MATRNKPSRNAGARRADGQLIAIRAYDRSNKLIEAFISSKSHTTIERMAMQWGYILRVRTRWAGDADIREDFGTRAFKDLMELGIARDKILQFASVEQIEVEFQYQESNTQNATRTLEAASEIPWEYLLSSATENVGRVKSLLVTRCLENNSKIRQAPPRNVLVVESAPGRIGQIYNFKNEETRLEAAVKLKVGRGLELVPTEPFSKLESKIREKAWDAIHVTGVDTHHAAWLIEDFYGTVARKDDVIDKSDCLQDGMILRGDRDSELPVRYDKLAGLLLKSKEAPQVISLNLYYSGARTARELVKRGAYAGLGFLDEIDDEFAELFFQAFYWAWCRDKKSISHAFLDAWSQMDGDRMYGTNIVIWLGRSIVGQPDTSVNKRAQAKKPRRGGR